MTNACMLYLCIGAKATSLLESTPSDANQERLLAILTKESGGWLHAMPVTALGLRKDDHNLRAVVGLRLGTAIVASHQC